MPELNIEELLEELKEKVKTASIFMMDRNFTVTQKGNDSNLVTSQDIKVQEYLEKELKALIPGSGFFGEESVPKDYKNKKYLWVVDPIDGTSNFYRGMMLSVISIALLKDGDRYLGLVYCPYTEEMFWAVKDHGAYLNDKRIHVSNRKFGRAVLFSAMSLYDKTYAHICFNIIEKVYMQSDDLRRLGTAALEMCYVACGRGDLYFEIRLSPWDYAASSLILEEAGGIVGFLYRDRLYLEGPSSVYGANNCENFLKLEEIIKEEVKQPLF